MNWSDPDAFWRAIDAAPGDMTCLLVFADWLAEQSDPREMYLRNIANAGKLPVIPADYGRDPMPGIEHSWAKRWNWFMVHINTLTGTYDGWVPRSAIIAPSIYSLFQRHYDTRFLTGSYVLLSEAYQELLISMLKIGDPQISV